MLRITVAAAKVNEIREAEGIEVNQALRLRVVGGGCAGLTICTSTTRRRSIASSRPRASSASSTR